MVSKHGHFILPRTFSDKVTTGIDFTVEVVVQCDAPVVKKLFRRYF